MSSHQSPILVLGAGSWGTALAVLLARNGWQVRLWDRDAANLRRLRETRQNDRYLPGIPLPPEIQPWEELETAISGCREVLMVLPSNAFADNLRRLAPQMSPEMGFSWATKGLEPGSARLLHQVARDILGPRQPLAVISGPTFAGEVARGLPTAVTVAADPPEAADHVAALLRGPTFRVYTSQDMIGVQIGAAAKNVIAIAAGIADGLGFGANTRAALITRGLAEIMRLGTALGGHSETFMGLAGLGDLMLTCTDNQSRNRRFGYALAKGQTADQAAAAIGQVVEGAGAVEQVLKLAGDYHLEMPISEQVREVLKNRLTPEEAVFNLLSREPRQEIEA